MSFKTDVDTNRFYQKCIAFMCINLWSAKNSNIGSHNVAATLVKVIISAIFWDYQVQKLLSSYTNEIVKFCYYYIYLLKCKIGNRLTLHIYHYIKLIFLIVFNCRLALKKAKVERTGRPSFQTAIELIDRRNARITHDVARAVDLILGWPPAL